MPEASSGAASRTHRELSGAPKGPNLERGPCIDIVYEFPVARQGNTMP